MIKIMLFLQGTLLMHRSGVGKTRQQIVKQSQDQGESVRDFASYVPIGHAVEKLQRWANQGVKILYLSALTENKNARGDEIVGKEGLMIDQKVLNRYGFPKGEIYHRQTGERYAQIAERLGPDVLIEDDCESIGGASEMTITAVRPEIKSRIKSIVVKEFGGIDELPDNLDELQQ